MLGLLPLVAEINNLWYSIPLIVAISLVYSGTRHEAISAILSNGARLALWIAVFMAATTAVLAFIGWQV